MAKVLTICILPIRDRPRHFHKLIVFLIDSRVFQKVQFFSFFSVTTKTPQWMKEGPKLNACKTLKLRESKAFSKSMATKIPDISLFIVCSITSSIVLMASKLVLPLTKALWWKWIISGSTFCNCSAKVLDAIFASTLNLCHLVNYRLRANNLSAFVWRLLTPSKRCNCGVSYAPDIH